MKKKRMYNITTGKSIFLAMIGVIAILQLILIPNGLDPLIEKCYYHVCLQWFVFLTVWFFVCFCKSIDMFEPFVLLSAVHFLIFEVTPLICIHNSNIRFFGVNVWGGCIKATYISTIGYLFFVCAYFIPKKRIIVQKDSLEHINKADKVLIFNYAVWIFSFICGLILIYGYGLNFRYLISGGMQELTESTNEKSAFGFLGIFFYAMIPSFLYIFELGKNRVIKILLFYLTFMSYYVRGFRFIMIACLLAPVLFLYLKKNKRPRIRTIVFLLIGLAVFSSFVEITRTSLRSGIGTGASFSDVISFDSVKNVIISNLEIVKTFYAIVEKYPVAFPYTYGSEIFVSTVLLLIPRALWPEKPSPPIYQVIENSLTSYARVAGTSFPYIGEYYFEFGIVGVCLFMVLLGLFLRKLKTYLYTNNIHDYILYASIFPLLFQVLIRGYTPTNFYMLLFVFLPTYISKRMISNQ